MKCEAAIDIDAAPRDVWAVLTDEGPFAVGSRARVRQPKLPAAVWEVTDLEPERSFTWTASAPGVNSTAEHRLTPRPAGAVSVTLGISQTGLLSPLVALLGSRITRRYVRMEAEGLKRRCEDLERG